MNKTTRLNNIQALRALAATAVAISHTECIIQGSQPFGIFGVDIFFVISGFIMARILDAPSGTGAGFFFRQRVLRVVPPYWALTLVTFFFAWHAPQLMKSTRANPIELLKSLLFIPFLKQSGNIQPLLYVGWTLNYEMFFYVALTAGILIWRRHAALVGSALVLFVILVCIPFAGNSTIGTFYGGWVSLEFIFGVLTYHIWRAVPVTAARRHRVLALGVCIVSLVALSTVVAIPTMIPLLKAFSQLDRSVSFGIPSFFLVLSASYLSRADWDIKLTWLILIGDASYMLYLTHDFTEFFIDRVLAKHAAWLSIHTAPGASIAVISSIAVGILVHLYVERPALGFLHKRFGGKRIASGK